MLVRYEDLRWHSGDDERIYSSLGVLVDERKLSEAVEKHSWENVPKKIRARASSTARPPPGSWKRGSHPKADRDVERITAPLLKEYYPG